MLKKMNLPNKLTILRMILVPVFIIFMALPIKWVWPLYVAFGIFIVAAITDKLDGHIARKNNLVTKFGKIMDPLADKLIVSAAFIMLAGHGVYPGWMIAVIIVRDFFVNGLRMFATDNDKDVAAGLSGKVKTAFQMITIPLAILGLALNAKESAFGIFITGSMTMNIFDLLINVFMTVTMAAVLLATVWSFVDYLIKFKDDIIEKDDDEENDTEEDDSDENKDDEEDDTSDEDNEDEITDADNDEVKEEQEQEEVEKEKNTDEEEQEDANESDKEEVRKEENIVNQNSKKSKKKKNKNK